MAMSMRSRGGGARRGAPGVGAQRVYEDFKPFMEWKHEHNAHILLVHLAGFQKAQIRVIAESHGVLKIRGERLVAENKWARFREEIPSPQDCNINETRAKFDGGILYVTLPKKLTILTPPVVQEPPKIMPEPRKLQEELPSRFKLPSYEPERAPKTGPPVSPPRKVQEELPPIFTPSYEPERAPKTGPPVSPPRKLQEEFPPRFTPSYEPERAPKSGPPVSPPSALSRLRGRQGEPTHYPEPKPTIPAKDANDNYLILPTMPKDYMNGMRGLSSDLNEDRQLLVNMGVAVLVIVALATYIAYSIGSSGTTNN